MPDHIVNGIRQLHLPQSGSHKGQNGKLLMIGGSELFHAASKWSLDVASQFVDMVFYASVPSNNELIQAVKKEFWNGIVIRRQDIEDYIQEADVILIGPGMERTNETEALTNELLSTYPTKKWVLDAGALQMVDVKLLTQNCIITPHLQECRTVYRKAVQAHSRRMADGSWQGEVAGESWSSSTSWKEEDGLWFEEAIMTSSENFMELDTQGKIRKSDFFGQLHHFSKMLHGTTVLLKGAQDFVFRYDGNYHTSPLEVITGGTPGMTKGGTGDVLAGLVAALFCSEPAFEAAVVGSYINKKAGEALAEEVGPFFNASQLVEQVPKTLWQELTRVKG